MFGTIAHLRNTANGLHPFGAMQLALLTFVFMKIAAASSAFDDILEIGSEIIHNDMIALMRTNVLPGFILSPSC